MKNPKIKFSQEWEKLKPENFKPGSIFSTFRKFRKSKFEYYLSCQGKIFDVLLKEQLIGKAKLLSVYKWRTDRITTNFIKRDTFPDWGKEEFHQLLRQFYGSIPEYGIILNFEVVEVVEKCIICGKEGATGYPGKRYCQEHYIEYLKEVHDWRRNGGWWRCQKK